MVLERDEKVVGADRVLAVLVSLADYPTGASLDDIAQQLNATKSTVHRALATLRRSGLVMQLGRGVYILGDEFYRLAFRSYAERPEGRLIRPTLAELARRFGETVHFAVLEGAEVIYRAKVDPPSGGIRLTSVVGGRNPARVTAVGKLLMSFAVSSRDELSDLVGDDFTKRTPHTIASVDSLWDDLQATRERGYGIDDQESEIGVNCIALPVRIADDLEPIGAVSVSALAFRLPLEQLVERVEEVRTVIATFREVDEVDLND